MTEIEERDVLVALESGGGNTFEDIVGRLRAVGLRISSEQPDLDVVIGAIRKDIDFSTILGVEGVVAVEEQQVMRAL